MTDLDAALGDAAVRERLPLRTGGTVAVTDDDLLISAGGDVTRVALDRITEVTVEEFDWFLGLLSAGLVAWGLYSTRRSLPLGLAFAAFGAGSLYWTYRKRGKARVKVVDRPKPLTIYPEDGESFTAAMEAALADVRAEIERGAESA
jgi:hypothetical protein